MTVLITFIIILALYGLFYGFKLKCLKYVIKWLKGE